MMPIAQQNAHANTILRWCSLFCLLAGTAALISYVYFWGDAHLYQAFQSQRFDALGAAPAVREGLSCGDLSPNPGAPIARLEIPRIGLSVVVLEGDDARTLLRGAGHVPGTARPGQAGNVAIAAHRDTFFRDLRGIRKGDVIRLTTLGGSDLYRVESIEVVLPSRTGVLDATAQPTLTLITCYPFFYVRSAPNRFIVRAQYVAADRSAPLQTVACKQVPNERGLASLASR